MSPESYFKVISMKQADYMAKQLPDLSPKLHDYYMKIYAQQFKAKGISMYQKEFDIVLNMCGHSYRARWLVCDQYGNEKDESGKYEKKTICKITNYLRFNKCVEFSYPEMNTKKLVIMNTGYSQVKLMDDL